MKKCSACKRKKPATKEYYHANRKKADGLNNECKSCRSKSRNRRLNKRSRKRRVPEKRFTPYLEPVSGRQLVGSNGKNTHIGDESLSNSKDSSGNPKKDLSRTRYNDVVPPTRADLEATTPEGVQIDVKHGKLNVMPSSEGLA